MHADEHSDGHSYKQSDSDSDHRPDQHLHEYADHHAHVRWSHPEARGRSPRLRTGGGQNIPTMSDGVLLLFGLLLAGAGYTLRTKGL